MKVAVRVNTRVMKHIYIPNTKSFFESLLGRISLVILATAVSGGVLMILFPINQLIPEKVLKFNNIVMIALIAGYSARRLLRQNTFMLRLLAAMTAVVVTYGLLFTLTHGFIGVELTKPYRSSPDWDGLLQMGAGFFSAWMVLRAWSVKAVIIPAEPAVPAPVVKPARIRTRPEFTWRPAIPRSLMEYPKRWFNRVSTPTVKGIGSAKIQVSDLGPSLKIKAPKRIRRTRVPRPAVQPKEVRFTNLEEHRCPFCLEEITRKDPRGIKTCEICKTQHHADCWEVTGICQVPHYQS